MSEAYRGQKNNEQGRSIKHCECAIEELPLLAEGLEEDLTTANQQYRERLLRQGVHDRQAGQEGRERERTDDNAAIDEALGKLKKR